MQRKFEVIWTTIENGAIGHGGSQQLLIYDVNLDGLEDILSFGVVFPPEPIGTAPFRIYKQNPDGSFVARNPMANGTDLLLTHPRDFVVADFNGDGINDIFIATHGYDTWPFPGEPNKLLFGTGSGTFVDASHRIPSFQDFSHGAAAGDIDGDGDLDIYVANIYGQHSIGPYLLINDGRGNFSYNTDRLPQSVVNGIPNNEKFMIAEIVDMDGDGYQDLVLGGDGIASRIYWGTPEGKYSDTNVTHLPFTTSAITVPHEFVVYDFNNDGRLDLLNIGGTVLSGPGALQLLVNDGGRGYVDKTAEFFPNGYHTQSSLYGARLVDINDDGWLDIIRDADFMLRNPGNDTLLWLNDGTNRFNAVTLAELGLTDDLMRSAFLGQDGEIRWLSQIQNTPDAQDRVNLTYYKPTDAFYEAMPEAPTGHLTGANDGAVNVARFFNVHTGAHFYTGTPEERDGLRGGGKGFVFEGNSFDTSATAEDGIAVFRFYNTHTGTHFYTASEEERDQVIATLPALNYEGIAYHAYADADSGEQALHRFYNTANGTHFYTANDEEKDIVIATLPYYNYEGIAYYVDLA